jgi:putative acetyltransferase
MNVRALHRLTGSFLVCNPNNWYGATMNDGVEIRDEASGDAEAIHRVNALAFGQPDEANLVDSLRAAGAALLSLVAVDAGRIVGHILFSPVSISSPAGDFAAVGLGPMAVLPDRQRLGIGSELVRRGLAALRNRGHGVVVVLGHPAYYPRFGFVRASTHKIRWEHDAPDEAFMVLELALGALAGRGGIVRYRSEFAGL